MEYWNIGILENQIVLPTIPLFHSSIIPFSLKIDIPAQNRYPEHGQGVVTGPVEEGKGIRRAFPPVKLVSRDQQKVRAGKQSPPEVKGTRLLGEDPERQQA